MSLTTVEMRTRKAAVDLPIVNFDFCSGEGLGTKHSELLPSHVRCIMCGPSNSGKTNVMLNLLFDPNGLKFETVYVFSKSLYQPKYKYLERVLASIPEVEYFPFRENEEVLHPNEVKENSVMIFDDVACEQQNNIRSYFTMGRHKNVDTFYLCQTYSRIPKHLIRDNANFLVLFKQDERNLRHVYEDHINTDMTWGKFKELCMYAWNKSRHGFLVVDKERDIDDGRYRLGIDEFIKVGVV